MDSYFWRASDLTFDDPMIENVRMNFLWIHIFDEFIIFLMKIYQVFDDFSLASHFSIVGRVRVVRPSSFSDRNSIFSFCQNF